MKLFSQLIYKISSSTKTNEKLSALTDYFKNAKEEDKLWMLALFTGRRPKRAVNSTRLREWAAEEANLPQWLFEESYQNVGDLAETIALILPAPTHSSDRSLTFWIEFLINIKELEEPERKAKILLAWRSLDTQQRFVFNKLMTGGFRIGVSKQLVINALAKTYQLEPAVVAHRISGKWTSESTTFDSLINGEHVDTDASKPYPFYLAYALEEEPHELGNLNEWQAEWKWDGIRGQIIKRKNEIFVWSRGEELMTEKFPEYQLLLNHLPNGIALDGEIIPWQNGAPLPFNLLQTRIGRKNITKKILESAPLVFIAYDLLEYDDQDFRVKTMQERRKQLEQIVADANHPVLLISPIVEKNSWEELAQERERSREIGSEGLMLKRKNSVYKTGRKRGDWWKWKVDPLTIDCVLTAAQKGHGRRANLYTDYTFAIRSGDQLVTLTKAYSGLTDKEFIEVDRFIKKNILEKFGPVRTVRPELVFEIAFEGIAPSKRHKSGVALRFPRMVRWRRDKKAEEANSLEDVHALLNLVQRPVVPASE
ncbi:MAG: ATP-dependent DNA ligase [Bacteroidota bacterium]